jgi:hypothetical protein
LEDGPGDVPAFFIESLLNVSLKQKPGQNKDFYMKVLTLISLGILISCNPISQGVVFPDGVYLNTGQLKLKRPAFNAGIPDKDAHGNAIGGAIGGGITA